MRLSLKVWARGWELWFTMIMALLSCILHGGLLSNERPKLQRQMNISAGFGHRDVILKNDCLSTINAIKVGGGNNNICWWHMLCCCFVWHYFLFVMLVTIVIRCPWTCKLHGLCYWHESLVTFPYMCLNCYMMIWWWMRRSSLWKFPKKINKGG